MAVPAKQRECEGDEMTTRIGAFIHVTLDGFFAGPNGEIDWFKVIKQDASWEKHTREESQSGGTLLMGRKTYEMMKSFWPTPAGASSDPHMAKVMNESPKIVISKSLPNVKEEGPWKNVTLLRSLDPAAIKGQGGNIIILGSGSIIRQLTDLNLIDEYELVVVPVILGAGTSLFEGVKKRELVLAGTQSFKNGLVSLRYRPSSAD
jgi:dihydrofolate reductase